MNEVNTEVEPEGPEEIVTLPGPGHRLRLARERMDMQPAEIAERLHLAERLVVALENDDYAELPDPVFTQGYLRNYARLVGEPVEEILDVFAKSRPTDEYRPVIRHTDVRTRIKARQVNSSHGLVKTITWLVVVVLAVFLVVAWRGYVELPLPLMGDDLNGTLEENGSQSENEATLQALPIGAPDTPGPGAETPTSFIEEVSDSPSAQTVTTPVAEPEPEAVLPSAGNTDMPDRSEEQTDAEPESDFQRMPATDTRVVEEPIPEQPADAEGLSDDNGPAASPEVSEVEEATAADQAVSLEFTAPCWVDVRDADGNKLLYGGRGTGERHTLEGVPPYRFVLGNHTAVRIMVGGMPFDTEAFSSRGVARFSIDPADTTMAPSESQE